MPCITSSRRCHHDGTRLVRHHPLSNCAPEVRSLQPNQFIGHLKVPLSMISGWGFIAIQEVSTGTYAWPSAASCSLNRPKCGSIGVFYLDGEVCSTALPQNRVGTVAIPRRHNPIVSKLGLQGTDTELTERAGIMPDGGPAPLSIPEHGESPKGRHSLRNSVPTGGGLSYILISL